MRRGYMGDTSGGPWGPDDGPDDDNFGASDAEILGSTQGELLDALERLGFFARAMTQMRTWVNLHRAGELSADTAFKQIELDIDRCLPRSKSDVP
jgi:hypothetical protein